jgi:hypothetical protein
MKEWNVTADLQKALNDENPTSMAVLAEAIHEIGVCNQGTLEAELAHWLNEIAEIKRQES